MGTFEASYTFEPLAHVPLDDIGRRFAERSGLRANLASPDPDGNASITAPELGDSVQITLYGPSLELSYPSAVPSWFLLDHLEAAIRECGGRPHNSNPRRATQFEKTFEKTKWSDLTTWQRLRERHYWLRSFSPAR
jgi:hypothetical protein